MIQENYEINNKKYTVISNVVEEAQSVEKLYEVISKHIVLQIP